MLQEFTLYNKPLRDITDIKIIINTLNAHCYNIAQSDSLYEASLKNSGVLIPDGISIVWAVRWLTGRKLKKIAGEDLFLFELRRLQIKGGKCFFLGSTEETLNKIKMRIEREYPKIIVNTYSPPFRSEFNEKENLNMLDAINSFQPNVLMIGMTAPKQEKWAYLHFDQLQVGHICCIGAVFDFYAGTVRRAPKWMINYGLEWFYRLLKEPKRMWRRYVYGNIIFIWHIIDEKLRNR